MKLEINKMYSKEVESDYIELIKPLNITEIDGETRVKIFYIFLNLFKKTITVYDIYDTKLSMIKGFYTLEKETVRKIIINLLSPRIKLNVVS